MIDHKQQGDRGAPAAPNYLQDIATKLQELSDKIDETKSTLLMRIEELELDISLLRLSESEQVGQAEGSLSFMRQEIETLRLHMMMVAASAHRPQMQDAFPVGPVGNGHIEPPARWRRGSLYDL